jgi:hypothetical protein
MMRKAIVRSPPKTAERLEAVQSMSTKLVPSQKAVVAAVAEDVAEAAAVVAAEDVAEAAVVVAAVGDATNLILAVPTGSR